MDINKRDPRGVTPLHAAILSYNKDMILFLVERGADVNAPWNVPYGRGNDYNNNESIDSRSIESLQPLSMLMKLHDRELIETFVKKGADIRPKSWRAEVSYITDPELAWPLIERDLQENQDSKECNNERHHWFTFILINVKHSTNIQFLSKIIEVIPKYARKGETPLNPLVDAAKLGSLSLFKRLLESKFNINDQYPIDYAVKSGNLELVQFILQHPEFKPDQDLIEIILGGCLSRHCIDKIKQSEFEIIYHLYLYQYNTYIKDNDSARAVFFKDNLYQYQDILRYTIAHGNLDQCKMLWDIYRQQENDSSENYRDTLAMALRESFLKNSSDRIDFFLNKMDENNKNLNGFTILDMAIEAGNLDWVKKLSKKCETFTDSQWDEAIEIAIKNKRIAVACYLHSLRERESKNDEYSSVNFGSKLAALCVANNDLKQLQDFAKQYTIDFDDRNSKDGQSLLLTALSSRECDLSLIDYLLQQKVDVNATHQQQTPLHYALQYRRSIHIIKQLLSRGASITASNSMGSSPIEIAISNNLVESFSAMLELADPSSVKTLIETQGLKLLACAIQANNLAAISELLLRMNALDLTHSLKTLHAHQQLLTQAYKSTNDFLKSVLDEQGINRYLSKENKHVIIFLDVDDTLYDPRLGKFIGRNNSLSDWHHHIKRLQEIGEENGIIFHFGIITYRSADTGGSIPAYISHQIPMIENDLQWFTAHGSKVFYGIEPGKQIVNLKYDTKVKNSDIWMIDDDAGVYNEVTRSGYNAISAARLKHMEEGTQQEEIDRFFVTIYSAYGLSQEFTPLSSLSHLYQSIEPQFLSDQTYVTPKTPIENADFLMMYNLKLIAEVKNDNDNSSDVNSIIRKLAKLHCADPVKFKKRVENQKERYLLSEEKCLTEETVKNWITKANPNRVIFFLMLNPEMFTQEILLLCNKILPSQLFTLAYDIAKAQKQEFIENPAVTEAILVNEFKKMQSPGVKTDDKFIETLIRDNSDMRFENAPSMLHFLLEHKGESFIAPWNRSLFPSWKIRKMGKTRSKQNTLLIDDAIQQKSPRLVLILLAYGMRPSIVNTGNEKYDTAVKNLEKLKEKFQHFFLCEDFKPGFFFKRKGSDKDLQARFDKTVNLEKKFDLKRNLLSVVEQAIGKDTTNISNNNRYLLRAFKEELTHLGAPWFDYLQDLDRFLCQQILYYLSDNELKYEGYLEILLFFHNEVVLRNRKLYPTDKPLASLETERYEDETGKPAEYKFAL